MELVIQCQFTTPFLIRDVILHIWGADCIDEFQSIFLFARSIKAKDIPNVEIPKARVTLASDRAEVKDLFLQIKASSSNSVEVKYLKTPHDDR